MTSDAKTNTPAIEPSAQESGEALSSGSAPATAQPELTVRPEVSEQCERLIQEFRLGRLDKVSAVLELTKVIPNTPDDREFFDRAFRSYCAMLDSFERFRDGARSQAAVPEVEGHAHQETSIHLENSEPT
jgi:hypothetical protein